jgi:AAA+ superfamily predicted ATPase
MQYAHIFGYRLNISSLLRSSKNNSLSIFKRILLLCGFTGVCFSFVKTPFNCDIYSQHKINCETLMEDLDDLIATETDPVLIHEYKQKRKQLEETWGKWDYEEKARGERHSADRINSNSDERGYIQNPMPVLSDNSVPIITCSDLYPEVYNAILPTAFNDIDKLAERFKRKLPSKAVTKKVIKEAKRQHPNLRQVIKQLKNPEGYERVKHPSRLLFVGPSGCGKTTTAEALAKYCDLICIFIKASSIATTYQNSGAQFFEMLFRSLKEYDAEEFLVIIDEISLITQMSSDGKDEQQNKMATAFWLGLDEIRNERHICVIGTTNSDPKDLPEQLKTRFANNIYHFAQPETETIISLIKDNLDFIPKEWSRPLFRTDADKFYTCPDTYIQQLAEKVSHLSLREVEDLVEKAKALAITESDDPRARVTVTHLETAFAEHMQSWYIKVWQNKSIYFKSVISPRAFTLYTAVTGLIMHFYTDRYKDHGLFIAAIASLISNYLPRPHGDPNDAHIFSNITHWFTNYKYPRFFRDRFVTDSTS